MARTTVLDRALRPVAQLLHKEFGKDVILRRITRVKNVQMGTVKNVVESEEIVRAVASQRGSGYGENLENLEPGAIEISIADKGMVGPPPSPGDVVIWGTDPDDDLEYKVLTVEIVHSGELVAMYGITVAH